jgi:hypothetical protein
MHDGSIATLEEVIQFYDGGREANPNLDPDIRPLGLTLPEKDALLTFLRALSSAQIGCQRDGMRQIPRCVSQSSTLPTYSR